MADFMLKLQHDLEKVYKDNNLSSTGELIIDDTLSILDFKPDLPEIKFDLDNENYIKIIIKASKEILNNIEIKIENNILIIETKIADDENFIQKFPIPVQVKASEIKSRIKNNKIILTLNICF
ncbi:MAG: Hsp20/alpha crystallin family protein [Candidatus Muiribacteriota bacterium]